MRFFICVTMSVAIVAPYDPHTCFVSGKASCGPLSGMACLKTRARVCEHGTGNRGRDSACCGRHLHHLCRSGGPSVVQVSVPTGGWRHRHCFPAYLLPGRAGGRSSLASWLLWCVCQVLVDESTQATEPECLIPILTGAKQLVRERETQRWRVCAACLLA